MTVLAGGLFGGLAGLLSWVLCRARAKPPTPVPVPIAERRCVGYCGSCEGPVLLDPVAHVASCPCGDVSLPERFLRYGVSA